MCFYAGRGLRKLAWNYLGYGVKEMYKGIYIPAQVKQLQRFVPMLQLSDVTRWADTDITNSSLHTEMKRTSGIGTKRS